MLDLDAKITQHKSRIMKFSNLFHNPLSSYVGFTSFRAVISKQMKRNKNLGNSSPGNRDDAECMFVAMLNVKKY